MLFRRKTLPDHLRGPHDAFLAQVEVLEGARGALMSCLPVGRVDPAPVAVGLDLLSDTLDELTGRLHEWRVEEVEAQWHGCVAAIAEAQAHLDPARRVAERSTELEELLGAVEDVDEPLGHAFSEAERAFLRLRR